MATVEFCHLLKVFDDGKKAINELSFRIADGEFIVIVGPSGCGKSTLLRLLAGLESASAGEIIIDGNVVNDMPPQARNIAMVFQNYALYPHMTARNNIAFPLRMMGLSKAEITQRVEKTADMLDLTPLLEQRPKQLSGGQRQRVAMGRAIVREPSVFLMDEPLSNLDAKLRVQIRGEIAALQQRLGITSVYVTHDQAEAMTLGDRVVVLRDGILQQVASPDEIYRNPANVFVATFFGNPGMNILRAVIRKSGIGFRLDIGGTAITLPIDSVESYVGLANRIDDTIYVGVRPEVVKLGSHSVDPNSLSIRVSNVEFLGHETLLYFNITDYTGLSECNNSSKIVESKAIFVARMAEKPNIDINEKTSITLQPESLYFFDIDGCSIPLV